MNGFKLNEKYLSQMPALQLLINLGYLYLSPSEALQKEVLFSGEFKKVFDLV